MPPKTLDSQTDRKGLQDTFKFGGGKNDITANDDGVAGYGYIINASGGDDTILGSDFNGIGFSGPAFDPLTDDARTEFGDLLIGGTGSDTITGGAGDDWIYGGKDDADRTDGGKGKDPIVKNELIGEDSQIIVAGGNTFSAGSDNIFGGSGVDNSIYGDNLGTVSLGVGATFDGGDDVLTGGDGLAGEFVYNLLVGDTQRISGSDGIFVGGDDTLIGGNGANVSNDMIGDTGPTGGVGDFTGGDDTFIGGEFAADTMTGDWASGTVGGEAGGADTFVIGPNGARDVILDFRPTDQSVRDDGFGGVIITDETVVLDGFDNITEFGDLTGRWFVDGLTGFGALDLDDTLNPDLSDGNDNRLVFSGYTVAEVSAFTSDSFDFV